MTIKLNDIVSYIETQAQTISDLRGKVKFRNTDEVPHDFKDYGLEIYVGSQEPKETTRKFCGPVVQELWTINVDFILNKSFVSSRRSISDDKAISYWENLLVSTFINRRNNYSFQDSWWEPAGPPVQMNDSIVLPGLFKAEVNNQY